MILTLVPDVSADSQGGVAAPASSRLLVDIVVSRSQKPGALVEGELAFSGTHARTAVCPVIRSELQAVTGPVV